MPVCWPSISEPLNQFFCWLMRARSRCAGCPADSPRIAGVATDDVPGDVKPSSASARFLSCRTCRLSEEAILRRIALATFQILVPGQADSWDSFAGTGTFRFLTARILLQVVLPGLVLPQWFYRVLVLPGQAPLVLPGQAPFGRVLPGGFYRVLRGQVLREHGFYGDSGFYGDRHLSGAARVLRAVVLPGQAPFGRVLPGRVLPGQAHFGS